MPAGAFHTCCSSLSPLCIPKHTLLLLAFAAGHVARAQTPLNAPWLSFMSLLMLLVCAFICVNAVIISDTSCSLRPLPSAMRRRLLALLISSWGLARSCRR